MPPRPKSQRTVTSVSRHHADVSGTSTPHKPSPASTAAASFNNNTTATALSQQDETTDHVLPNGQSQASSAVTSPVRQLEASPRAGRKVLPKPKPPNVRKVRRTSQTSLHSRSNDNLDAAASQSAATSHHQRAVGDDNDSQAAGGESHHDAQNRTSTNRVLPKPRPQHEWSNTSKSTKQSMTSRRPILKHRAASQQAEELPDSVAPAHPAADVPSTAVVKPASLNMTHSGKRLE